MEFGEALVSKVIADMAEEVSAAGFSVEEFLVVPGRKFKVAINVAAAESQVKNAAASVVRSCGEHLRLNWQPVHHSPSEAESEETVRIQGTTKTVSAGPVP